MPLKNRPVALHIITGLNDGGAEAVLFDVVRNSNDFDHVVVSLLGPGKYGPLMERVGLSVSYLNLSSVLASPFKMLKLIRIIRKIDPDVIQTWMYHADFFGGLAAWLAGYPNIVWGLHHTTLDKNGSRWTTRILVRMNGLVSSWLPKRIISCSKKGEMVHLKIGYPRDAMVVVHNGYNTDSFKPDVAIRTQIRNEFNIPRDQILLGCVARYNPQKDHRNLLEAFTLVTKVRGDTHLMLVGPGLTDENKEIVDILEVLGLQEQVTLVGPRTDIPSIMNGLDLHVLSSAFGEAFPNVLSEAMSSGTPCVATNVGDSAVIIGETGEICAPSNSEELSRAIHRMLDRIDEPNLAIACRKRVVDNFTLERMVDGYQSTWRAAMGIS